MNKKFKCKRGVEKKGCINDIEDVLRVLDHMASHEYFTTLSATVDATGPSDTVVVRTSGPGCQIPANDPRLKREGKK